MQVTAAAFATAGLRGEDRMEDRHLLASPLPGSGSGPGAERPSEAGPPAGGAAHLLAVFDGHRGDAAAEFGAVHLAAHLRAAWGMPTARAALQAAFIELDAAFQESQVGPRVRVRGEGRWGPLRGLRWRPRLLGWMQPSRSRRWGALWVQWSTSGLAWQERSTCSPVSCQLFLQEAARQYGW